MTTENEIQPVQPNEITVIPDVTSSEIDRQIATAKRYPRSIQKFRQDALSMATADKDIAASCFYKLKRNNANGEAAYIEGPSVRLAEIVANAWGNLRFGARISAENEREVVAQGIAYDLEKNVCNTIEVSRRITTKAGKRYGDDMIQVTKNAACSIALRNAIFKTVPFTYAKSIYEQAKQVAVGDVKTMAERRQSMLAAFQKMNVTKEQVLGYLEKPSIEDIGLSEIESMIGVFNAIKDGDTTIEEQFQSVKPQAEDFKSMMRKKEGSPSPAPTPAPETAQNAPVSVSSEPLASPGQLKNLLAMALSAGVQGEAYKDFLIKHCYDPDKITISELQECLQELAAIVDKKATVKK